MLYSRAMASTFSCNPLRGNADLTEPGAEQQHGPRATFSA